MDRYITISALASEKMDKILDAFEKELVRVACELVDANTDHVTPGDVMDALRVIMESDHRTWAGTLLDQVNA